MRSEKSQENENKEEVDTCKYDEIIFDFILFFLLFVDEDA